MLSYHIVHYKDYVMLIVMMRQCTAYHLDWLGVYTVSSDTWQLCPSFYMVTG